MEINMRTGTLLVGDLIHMYGLENIIGVVVCERREGVYDIHIFQDNRIFTFPRGMLQKVNKEE
jgi:hypothetical protein